MPFKPSYFKTELFKILSNPTRIQILDALRQGALSVNAIAEWLEIEPTAVSQQLAILRRASLVDTEKKGTYVIYSIRDPAVFKVLDAAKEVFDNHLIDIRDALEKL